MTYPAKDGLFPVLCLSPIALVRVENKVTIEASILIDRGWQLDKASHRYPTLVICARKILMNDIEVLILQLQLLRCMVLTDTRKERHRQVYAFLLPRFWIQGWYNLSKLVNDVQFGDHGLAVRNCFEGRMTCPTVVLQVTVRREGCLCIHSLKDVCAEDGSFRIISCDVCDKASFR